MHKKSVNRLILFLFAFFLVSCHEAITEIEPITSNRLSKSQAANLIKNTFYPSKYKSAVFGFSYILPSNTSI